MWHPSLGSHSRDRTCDDPPYNTGGHPPDHTDHGPEAVAGVVGRVAAGVVGGAVASAVATVCDSRNCIGDDPPRYTRYGPQAVAGVASRVVADAVAAVACP